MRGKQYLPAFLAGFLLALLPFLIAVVREGYGHHIASLSPWGGWFKEFAVATGLFKYFAVLVWGAFEKDPAYVPVWGGFLNPLLGAFFFLGAVEMIRRRGRGTVRFLAAAFVLFLLPGALSPNLEGFRVAQVLPLLLVVTAFGLHSCLASFPGPGRVLILTVVLATTAAFDHERLSRPYRDPGTHPEDFGRPLRSLEKYRAYQLVVPNIAGLGSGNLYAHFQADAFNDPTFALMVSPFNAADPWGPAASDFTSKQPGWEAFLVDRHFRPFLSRRFPGARWFPLPGESVLVILSRGEAGSWPEFHGILQKADRERFAQTRADFDPLLRSLLQAGSLAREDPFLASLFWDKVAAYQYERLDYAGQLEAHRRAIEEGYPAAHLYFKLGQLRLIGRDAEGAREAFQKAVRAPENRTDAQAWLDRLGPAKTE